MFPANDPYAFISPGQGSWYFLLRQPVAEPPEQATPWMQVYLELAQRLDILDDLYRFGNEMWHLRDDLKLEQGQKYSVRDIAQRQAQTIFGTDRDLADFTESSSAVLREKSVEEAYPRMFMPSRVPIYLEYYLDHKQDVKKITEELELEWDLTPYSPVPIWIPCEAHEHDPDYDLIATNNKVPTHQFSVTTENLLIKKYNGWQMLPEKGTDPCVYYVG